MLKHEIASPERTVAPSPARVVGGVALAAISVLLLLSFHNLGVFAMPLVVPAMWFAASRTRSSWVAGCWVALGALAASETAWLFGEGWGLGGSTWFLAPLSGAGVVVVFVGSMCRR